MMRWRASRAISAVVLRPIGRLLRLRVRVTLDMLMTLAVTLAAVVLAVGYQVLGRWPRRGDPA